MTKCIPVRVDDRLANQLDIWAEGKGIPLSQAIREILSDFVAERVAVAVAAAALAAGSRRAKTPKAVECEASQSGPKGNAQTQSGRNPE